MKGGLLDSGQSVTLWRRLRHFLISPREGGFTVIEVLIVLAVSGALFVSAAILISGRQNQTAFDQSIRQIQSQIQQALNEVAVGYYPNKSQFQCLAGPTGPVLSGGSNAQGTNSGCIFLGKALQFKVGGTDPEAFAIYTIAGLQRGGASGAESASLAEAKPMAVAPSITHSSAGYPDNSVVDTLQNGLTTARMWYNDGGPDVEIGAIAFVNSLAQYSGSIISGSGQVNIVPLSGTTLDATKDAAAEAINSDGGNSLATSVINPSDGVYICFSSGGTDNYGIVKIGGKNRELSVTLTIKNKGGATCS